MLHTARFAILCLASILCSACQYSPGMVDRTVSYNEAVSESNNQILLLNVVRASHREPTYYSRLQGNTAISTLTPMAQLTSPLEAARQTVSDGAKITRTITRAAFSLVSQLQATETNSISLQTLDEQKYIRGMMNFFDADMFRYFAYTGRSAEFLGLLFFQKIDVPEDARKLFVARVKERCAKLDPVDYMGTLCDALEIDRRDGPLTQCLDSRAQIPLINNGAIEESQRCFQAALRGLVILGLMADDAKDSMAVVQRGLPRTLLRDAKFVETAVANGLTIATAPDGKLALCKVKAGAPSGGPRSVFRLAHWDKDKGGKEKGDKAKPADDKPTTQQQCIDALKPANEAPPAQSLETAEVSLADKKIALTLRSTEGVIYYLGQIARSQTELNRNPPVLTAEWDGLEPAKRKPILVPLFVVQSHERDDAAVSVEFDGDTYSIPKPLCSDGKCSFGNNYPVTMERPAHRSLDVLTLVNQMWGLQKEASTFGPAPAVTVINP